MAIADVSQNFGSHFVYLHYTGNPVNYCTKIIASGVRKLLQQVGQIALEEEGVHKIMPRIYFLLSKIQLNHKVGKLINTSEEEHFGHVREFG